MGRSIRIGILGAGIAGACAALELASRGFSVDLYDEQSQPITGASFANEGKIHLGILYAKDPSGRTARLMIEGALAFAPLLRKWTGIERFAVSTPFYYGVHRGTMVPIDKLKQHYEKCRLLFEEAIGAGAEPYLGLERSISTEEIARPEMEALVNCDFFETIFRTSELGVDPHAIALSIRNAVKAEPRINFIGSAHVSGVSADSRDGLQVIFDRDGATHHSSYDHVVNALWQGRLVIDDQMGLRPSYPWSYRYKFGNRVRIRLAPSDIPSITCVLGPFGDIVNYQNNGLFLSWYPEGMIGTSYDLCPPAWNAQLTAPQRMDIFNRSFAEWLKRCPLLSNIVFSPEDVDPIGGVIFATGNTPVEDQDSKLHHRNDPGIYSVGNYHSVNTGKYTLGPLMGLRAAERVLGI